VLKFLLVVIVLSAAIYLAVRVIQQRGLMPDKPVLPRRQPPPKIVAPDDDEDFLRDLDRKRLNPEDPE
jgi:hypothetical protein